MMRVRQLFDFGGMVEFALGCDSALFEHVGVLVNCIEEEGDSVLRLIDEI